jgi:hypothetical protein
VPRLPAEPETDVVAVTVEGGTASWMPARWADRPVLVATVEAARVVPPGLRPVEPVDVSRWRVTEASPVLTRHRLVPGAPWRLRLVGDDVEGRPVDIVVQGRWWELAWLGKLAAWPDPSVQALPPVSVAGLDDLGRPPA